MKTAIYGAGQAGRMCCMWLSKEHDVVCYIDSDPRKQGTFIDGIPVVGPDDMPRTDIVWVAVINKEAVTEIKRMLTQKGRAKEIRDITGLRQDFDLRLCSLRLLALSVKERKIGGSLAELGVYQGAFAAEISRLFPERKIVLFDTFAGFAEKDMEKGKGSQRPKTLPRFLRYRHRGGPSDHAVSRKRRVCKRVFSRQRYRKR